MAILFLDSFDHYTTVTQKYQLESSTGGTITSAAGRNGNGFQTTVANRFARRTLAGNYTTLVFGCAHRWNGSTAAATPGIFLIGEGNSAQCMIGINSASGRLVVTQGQDGTQLGISDVSNAISANVWYYIEAKVEIGNSAAVEVRVNGVTWISISGVDTQATANAYANMFWIGRTNNSNSVTQHWDDYYVLDTTGPAPLNNFLGDVRVDVLFPAGAGNYGQFTRGGADSGANWSQVDEAAPNDVTDYVYSTTPGHRDSYAFTDLSGTGGSVYAAGLNARFQKSDSGARTVRLFARHGGANGAGTTFVPGAGSWEYRQDFINTNPSTSLAWTPSEINAAEFGIEVVT